MSESTVDKMAGGSLVDTRASQRERPSFWRVRHTFPLTMVVLGLAIWTCAYARNDTEGLPIGRVLDCSNTKSVHHLPVRFFCEDSAGDVWGVGEDYLMRRRASMAIIEMYPWQDGRSGAEGRKSILSGDDIDRMAFDSANRLWIVDHRGLTIWTADDVWHPIPLGGRDGSVTALSRMASGRVLVAFEGLQGIWHYENGGLRTVPKSDEIGGDIADLCESGTMRIAGLGGNTRDTVIAVTRGGPIWAVTADGAYEVGIHDAGTGRPKNCIVDAAGGFYVGHVSGIDALPLAKWGAGTHRQAPSTLRPGLFDAFAIGLRGGHEIVARTSRTWPSGVLVFDTAARKWSVLGDGLLPMGRPYVSAGGELFCGSMVPLRADLQPLTPDLALQIEQALRANALLTARCYAQLKNGRRIYVAYDAEERKRGVLIEADAEWRQRVIVELGAEIATLANDTEGNAWVLTSRRLQMLGGPKERVVPIPESLARSVADAEGASLAVPEAGVFFVILQPSSPDRTSPCVVYRYARGKWRRVMVPERPDATVVALDSQHLLMASGSLESLRVLDDTREDTPLVSHVVARMDLPGNPWDREMWVERDGIARLTTKPFSNAWPFRWITHPIGLRGSPPVIVRPPAYEVVPGRPLMLIRPDESDIAQTAALKAFRARGAEQ